MPVTDQQLQIIRQSSLNRAVDIYTAGKCDKKDILPTAQYFVNFVLNGHKQQSKRKLYIFKPQKL